MDVSGLSAAASPVIDLATIAVVCVGVYFAARQERTQYTGARPLLVLTWAVFLAVVFIQFASDAYERLALSQPYTLLSIPLILIDVTLLNALAYLIYARQSDPRLVNRIKAMSKRRNRLSAALLVLLTSYLFFVMVYAVVYRPFTSVALPDVFGAPSVGTRFDSSFVPFLALVLVGFLAYTCGHLLLAARNLADRTTARSLRVFAAGWAVSGLALFLLVGYSGSLGFDLSAPGFLVVAVSFSASVSVFRRGTSLAGFFGASRSAGLEERPFTGGISPMGQQPESLGGMILMEVNPASGYEAAVRDFAFERASEGGTVFVTTSKGTPVHQALLKMPRTRFFILTGGVNYAKPGASDTEVLVPEGNEAVLFQVIEDTRAASPEREVSFVFDSISDMIMLVGFERTYKFLKRVVEATSGRRSAMLFLLVAGAHEARMADLIRNLFAVHLSFDARGLRATRRPPSRGAP